VSTARKAKEDSSDSLREIAEREPYRLFNQTECAQLMHISRENVRELRRMGAPFFHGYSRPELILEWLHKWLTKK
jgi:hypothetical protein